MTVETHALRKRRKFLLEQLSRAADDIARIDARLTFLLEGKKPPSSNGV